MVNYEVRINSAVMDRTENPSDAKRAYNHWSDFAKNRKITGVELVQVSSVDPSSLKDEPKPMSLF